MQSWFVYLMMSTVAWGLADFLAKVLFRKHQGLTVAGYLVASWVLEIGVLLVYVVGRKADVALDMYALWLFRGLLAATFVVRFGSNILYFSGMKHLDASLVTVLFTFSTIVTVLLGVVVHGESWWWIKALGVALTIGAIVLVYHHVSVKKKHLLFFWCVLGAAVLYGIAANIEKVVGLHIDPFVFRLWYSLFSVGGLLMLYPRDIAHDVKYTKHISFRVINGISALLFMVVNVAYYYSFAAGAEAGKVDAINNVAIFLIIALEFFVFGDRDRWLFKLIAAGLSCLWIWLLY